MFSNDKVNELIEQHNIFKVIVDLTKKKQRDTDELSRTKHGLPVNILYPTDPDMPGVLLTGTISANDALKALRYVLKYSGK